MSRGLNVVGYLSTASGLGQVARLLVRSLEVGGIPHVLIDQAARRRHGGKLLDTSVICVNPENLPALLHGADPELLSGRRAVGFWWWEVEQFPARWRWAAEIFDELWVGSDHVRSAISGAVDKPVYKFPVPIVEPRQVARRREELGLPSGFLFLFAFDYESGFVRKNPLGLIDAFARSFGGRDDVWLALKTSHGERFPSERDELRSAARSVRNVRLLENLLPSADYDALLAACDAYVSLHRAEGFGLTMAEAMAFGKPVIATGYSGNLEFMTPGNSYLVPWSPSAIPVGLPYQPGTPWAEPDLDAAARLMREVFEHRDEAQRRAGHARERLLLERSPQRAAQFVEERLAALAGAQRASSNGLALAAERLLRGPNLYSNRASLRWARKLALPFFRPYVDHQVEVGQLLLEEVDKRLGALDARVAEIEARREAHDDR